MQNVQSVVETGTSLPIIAIPNKTRTILLLAFAELLAMGVSFSASAVVPALTQLWRLDATGQALMTISVQLGFVAGALTSAILNLADRLPSRWLLASSAWLAGLTTALIALLANGLEAAVVLRFLTGALTAGIYPVGMKIVATWTKEDRGLGIGLLVGALTVGTAGPHLLNAFGGVRDWQFVLYGSAALAGLGGLIAFVSVREGPYKTAAPPFNWKYIGKIVRQKELVLANLGYLGHMWELYAMWAWVPIFLLVSYRLAGLDAAAASIAAFAVIASGGIGSLLAGRLADRLGRTTLTIASLLISGACSLLVGFFFGGNVAALSAICLVWGFAVVADSAQFSACISELCDKEYMGTALTMQTSLGFMLTIVTLRLIPTLETAIGWQWAFVFLALGPALGIAAMAALRALPDARKLAGGRR